MPKFLVTLEETVRYTVEVEAETENEANADAVETWNNSEDPFGDFDGSGNGVEVAFTRET